MTRRARTSRPRRPSPAGFTLVELLVVIGIIALLMGILLPTLGRVREVGKATVCLSNLRQMAGMAQLYVDKNNGRYPIAYYQGYSGTTSVSYAWDLTTTWGPGQPKEVVGGLLWDGQGAERIQQCPSFEGKGSWLVDPYTGYNYNTSFIGHGQWEAVVAPTKAVAVRDPAGTALFGDGQWSGGANKFMRAPFPNPGDSTFAGRWSGTQGYRHLKKTNVAFCDGHTESWPERSTANADGAENVAADTGFLSADNGAYDLR